MKKPIKTKFDRERGVVFGEHRNIPPNASRYFTQQYVNSSFSGRGIDKLVSSGALFYLCLFSMSAEYAAFSQCTFMDCRFQECSFSRTKLVKCEFTACSLETSDFGNDIRVTACTADAQCTHGDSLSKRLFQMPPEEKPVFVSPFEPIEDSADDDDDDTSFAYAHLYGGYEGGNCGWSAAAGAASTHAGQAREAILLCRSEDEFRHWSQS